MTKTIWTGTISAVIVGAALSALAQTPQPPDNRASADRITVTGCLKAAPTAETNTTAGTTGTTSPTATAGTTGATGAAAATDAAEAKFVLADATASAAKADTGSAPAPETTTTPGTSASTPHAQTYRLVANAAALSPHVGKKLELTGTLVDQAASATTTASGPTLKVESGKVIAASCQE